MARKPLGPKPQSPIVPIALKLKEQGYQPIWLYSGKDNPPLGWTTLANEVDDIAGWRGQTVALQMNRHDDLFAIDLDVQRQDVLDAIWSRYQERWPDFCSRAVIRHSKRIKIMLIGRLATDRKHMYSGRYGVTAEHPGGNRVELFTANDARYIAVWGLHSEGRSYGYDGVELADVPLADLPVFLESDLNELLTIADEVMAGLGLPLVEPAGADLDEAVYDLRPDQVAELKDGRTLTLTELADECQGEFVYIHGRIFDPGSDSFRVKCKMTSAGLTLWDFGTALTHYWKHLGPQMEVLGPLLKRLAGDAAGAPEASMFLSVVGTQAKAKAAGIGVGGRTAPPMPPDDADYAERLLWLLDSYGYCALNDTVVGLYELGEECEWKPTAFARRFTAWYREEPTRGGVRKVAVTEDWAYEASRIHVEGARMHPGQIFPCYQDGGKLWKNIYRRPVHEGTGDLGPFLAFFERFIPDRREREWLLDWMSHKQLRPDIPGSAVILVADNDEEEDERTGKYGTGRGLMFKILHRLYGPQYARSQSFSILDGSSGQSTYNSWLHGRVLTTVDESKTSATAHRRGEKKSVYEVLKDIVDPAPKGNTFNVKYGRAFYGMSYCSFWLATNHADALSIPPNDRRFTVLNNGGVLTPEEGRALAEWLEVPGNIAELSRFLAARDLAGFNMFQHLETEGKRTMIEMGRSEAENRLIELRDDDSRGLVFTRQQLEHAIEDIVNPWERKGATERRRGSTQWRGEFAGVWTEYCVGLKTAEGAKARVSIDGRQVKLYCFRKRRADATKLNAVSRRAEAIKWGGIEDLKDHLKGLQGGKGV